MRDSPSPEVHVVDDDVDTRDSLTSLLRSAGFTVNVYSSAAEFLALYRIDRPGCLLFDVRLPDFDGLELLERLKAFGTELPVIMMTAYADVPMAVRAIQAGAVEFVEKPFDWQALLAQVKRVIEEDIRRHRERVFWQDFRLRLSDLTSRERDVMELVLSGVPNKYIATHLDITERTVELRRASVLKKLQVQTTAELVRLTTEFEVVSGIRKLMPGAGPVPPLSGADGDDSPAT